MDKDVGPRRTGERYMGHIERLAKEAGKAMDRTMQQVETSSRQLYQEVSKETKASAREFARRTSIMMDEAKNELPRLRAELREMEARVRERIK